MAGTRLLIVDDEPDLLAELKPLLGRSGYEVETARDGREALEAVERYQPELIILDVLMPQIDGRAVLRQLRQAGNWTPIILLTKVGTPTERALSLQEGADDYLNKPFEPMELIARILAVLRRSKGQGAFLPTARYLVSDGLRLDRQTRQSWRGKEELPLTTRALGVLEYLMLHPQEILTRDHLLDEVWGWANAVGTRAVDIRIAEIRRTLGDDSSEPRYVETVVGHGYRWLPRVEGHS